MICYRFHRFCIIKKGYKLEEIHPDLRLMVNCVRGTPDDKLTGDSKQRQDFRRFPGGFEKHPPFLPVYFQDADYRRRRHERLRKLVLSDKEKMEQKNSGRNSGEEVRTGIISKSSARAELVVVEEKNKGQGGPSDSWFCPSSMYSTTEWLVKRKSIKYGDRGVASQGIFAPEIEEAIKKADDRRYYCDKLPQDVRPWPYMLPHGSSSSEQKKGSSSSSSSSEKEEKPRLFHYKKSDLVVGIYTGESVTHSRGMAVQDTWLADLPNVVLYTATEQAHVPTTGVRELQKEWQKAQNSNFEKNALFAPPGRNSPNPFNLEADYVGGVDVTHWIQLYGLKHMYEKFPDKKWYYIVGCDLYLNVDHALGGVLSEYDAEQPWWISRQVYPRMPLPEKAFDGIAKHFEKTCLRDKKTGKCDFTWSSGSYGWFLSNAVPLILDVVSSYLEEQYFYKGGHWCRWLAVYGCRLTSYEYLY